jgi:hypothetical protein
MKPPDDERIARLTDLARRVWPDRNARVAIGEEGEEGEEEHGACVILDELGEWEQHLGITHPRALDALEAALLVLSSPHSGAMRLALRDLAEHGKLSTAKVTLRDEPPAWVELLASEWEKLAKQADHKVREPAINATAALVKGAILTLGDAFRHCAAKLRERAKEKP